MDRNEYYTRIREVLSHIPEGKGNEMFNTSAQFRASIECLVRGQKPSLLLFELSKIIETQNEKLNELISWAPGPTFKIDLGSLNKEELMQLLKTIKVS